MTQADIPKSVKKAIKTNNQKVDFIYQLQKLTNGDASKKEINAFNKNINTDCRKYICEMFGMKVGSDSDIGLLRQQAIILKWLFSFITEDLIDDYIVEVFNSGNKKLKRWFISEHDVVSRDFDLVERISDHTDDLLCRLTPLGMAAMVRELNYTDKEIKKLVCVLLRHKEHRNAVLDYVDSTTYIHTDGGDSDSD